MIDNTFFSCISFLSAICVCNFGMCQLPNFIHFVPRYIFILFPLCFVSLSDVMYIYC